METCSDCGRVHDQERPNIAVYHRPSRRHQWRRGSTIVNASPCAVPTVRVSNIAGDPNVYAEVPYDWEVWAPPRSARALPGITREMLALIER